MKHFDMGYYNRLFAEQYIDNHSEDMAIIIDMIRNRANKYEVINLLRTDPKLSLFECSNIYRLIEWRLSHR